MLECDKGDNATISPLFNVALSCFITYEPCLNDLADSPASVIKSPINLFKQRSSKLKENNKALNVT